LKIKINRASRHSDAVYRLALDAVPNPSPQWWRPTANGSAVFATPFGNQWIIATQIGPSYAEGLAHSITTFVAVPEAARFIEFLERGLGATQLMRVDGEGGTVRHSVIRVGDSVLCVSNAREEAYPPGLYLHVPDVDAWYARAIRAGAQPTLPPADQSYGDRGAGVTDEWGNFWYMATPL
jgi:PhnB protein